MFFLAFFPQFIHPAHGSTAGQIVGLGAVFWVIGVIWDFGIPWTSGSIGARLHNRPRIDAAKPHWKAPRTSPPARPRKRSLEKPSWPATRGRPLFLREHEPAPCRVSLSQRTTSDSGPGRRWSKLSLARKRQWPAACRQWDPRPISKLGAPALATEQVPSRPAIVGYRIDAEAAMRVLAV